jgi:predicted nucleic acid-binding Zn finger protein
MTATKHFHVTRRAADALGITVINVLSNAVLVRTNNGPRFMSRKKFDAWEVGQRSGRASHCRVQRTGAHVWTVEDPMTNSGAHTVIRTGAHAKGIEGKWSCTCTDAHFMMERGQQPCCKHILAVHLKGSVK